MTDFDRQDLKFCVGMYHKENVDYASLIWEDVQYQIDNMQLKVRRHDIMPYPKFTKIIIHYFLSQHNSISKRQGLLYNTFKDDGVLGRLKFISKGEEHQMFIALSTGLIPPKKGRGKEAQGTKATVIPNKETVSSTKKKPKKKESSAQLEIDTQTAIKASRRKSIFQHQSGGSSEVVDNDDHEMTDAGTLVEENPDKEYEENAKKVKEQKVDEEQKGDDQAENE
ncbi:hypothetical protein Tco_0834018 [Tanacetum coccineum]